MKIFIGADHRGFELKNLVREHLSHQGYEVEDVGAMTMVPDDDYPQYAFGVGTKVLGEENPVFGILVCGSGQGMAIAANKVPGIRAAIGWSVEEAKSARNDDDVNVLVLPSDMIEPDLALTVVDAFIDQKFSGEERHVRRLAQIREIFS